MATRLRLMAPMQQTNAGPRLDEARVAHQESGKQVAAVVGSVFRIALVAVLLALLVRTLLVQPFNIPSGSMVPGLIAGDFILVDKAAYGWSRASLPFHPGARLLPGEPVLGAELPAAEQVAAAVPARLMGKAPVAGDVIVFAEPANRNTGKQRGLDYVKRVIASGGERVSLRAGQVILNGRALPCEPVQQKGKCIERTPGGASYLVHSDARGRLADFAEITVPEGQYFVLGDNRGDSADSRLAVADGGVGLVQDWQIIGRAWVIFFSVGDGRVRWERLGSSAQ